MIHFAVNIHVSNMHHDDDDDGVCACVCVCIAYTVYIGYIDLTAKIN